MAKQHRYKFHSESLSYVKVKRHTLKIVLKFFSYFLASVMLAVIYYIIFSPIYNSPEERRMIRQYKLLDKQYDTLMQKYKMVEEALGNIQARDTSIYRSVFYSNPISPFGSVSTSDEHLDLLGSHNNIEMVHRTNERIVRIETLSGSNHKKFETIQQMLKDSSQIAACIPAIQPVENKTLTRVGASVGLKVHPFYKILRMHTGIDYAVPIGTEVLATGNGTVANVEADEKGDGTSVTINHGFGYTTTYAHLSKVTVSKGAKVKRGQTIALSGDSGTSIWPHLHYEVRKNGKVHNPANYFFGELSPEELDIVINLSSNTGQSLD